jgi:cyclase
MASMRSAHYDFEPLGSGLVAAIARRDGYSICNSGLVDLDGGTLVFDTSLVPASARDLRAACESYLGHAPTVAANSHWHLDHSLGNSELEPIPIWGTERTRGILLERGDALTAELRRETLESELRELEAARDRLGDGDARRDVEVFIGIDRALLASLGEVKISPPNRTFDTHLRLPGKREAELLSFGAAHTEADAVLFLRDEGLLFAGDLVLRNYQPSMGSGDPEHWLVVLDQVERLGAERLVPGHGAVGGTEAIAETRQYLASILDAAESPISTLPSVLRRWEGSLSLRENLKFVREWLQVHRRGE